MLDKGQIEDLLENERKVLELLPEDIVTIVRIELLRRILETE